MDYGKIYGKRGVFIFQAKSQKIVLVIILFLIASNFTRSILSPIPAILWVELLSILFMAFITMSIFLNYKLWIDYDTLEYIVYLYKLPIYKRRVVANQIDEIKFKRYGWAVKGAIIKTRKKINLRVVNFYPKEVYEELNHFAEKTG